MLENLFEWFLTFLFLSECGACGKWLGPPRSRLGVCLDCETSVRLISPPFCPSCGRTSRQTDAPCGRCLEERKDKQPDRPCFDRAYACAFYEGKTKELLHTYKYHGRHRLRNYFAKGMSDFVCRHLRKESFDEVLAVPLETRKLRSRGYNQSGLISSVIARQLQIPESSSRIRRIRSEASQSLLTKSERESKIKGCFLVKNNRSLTGKRLLLIDDVLTTGQTTSECSRVLKEAGASRVTVLACARGS